MPAQPAGEVPDGIAVLNAKTRNILHAVRLNRADAAVLATAAGSEGRELVPTDLRTEGEAVAVYFNDTRLGRLPATVAERFAPLVRDHESRGWRFVTWTDVVSPADSIAAGGSRSGPALVAEVRLPAEHEPLFADAYDASFAFPYKMVMARQNTPEGKAEHDAFVASIPPPRETVIVRVGAVAVRASRCPWEGLGRPHPPEPRPAPQGRPLHLAATRRRRPGPRETRRPHRRGRRHDPPPRARQPRLRSRATGPPRA